MITSHLRLPIYGQVPSHSACGGNCSCGGCGKAAKTEGVASSPKRVEGPKTDAGVKSSCGSGCSGDCSSCGVKTLMMPPQGLAEIRPPVKW